MSAYQKHCDRIAAVRDNLFHMHTGMISAILNTFSGSHRVDFPNLDSILDSVRLEVTIDELNFIVWYPFDCDHIKLILDFVSDDHAGIRCDRFITGTEIVSGQYEVLLKEMQRILDSGWETD